MKRMNLYCFPWMGSSRLVALMASLLLGLGSTASGCGGEGVDASGSPEDAGSDISLDASTGGSSGEESGSQVFGGMDEEGNCLGLEVADGCGGEVYEGELVPLDLYMMFDQSGSMDTIVDQENGTMRIDVVREAVRAFLDDEESIGMGSGIGYFGYLPLGETSCDPAEYAEPDVEIGPLPGQTEAVLSSLQMVEPTGATPTGAAIRGACDYAQSYRQEHLGRAPAILLVTDGNPKTPKYEHMCKPTLADAVAAAKECFESAGIRTYVLGIGPSLSNLNQIAEAGGTKEAYLADLDNTDQVLSALRAVRGAARLPCELTLSPDDIGEEGVEFGASTVAYLDVQCQYHSIPEVKDESSCKDGVGWYFDDMSAPTRIHLCETTCGEVKSVGEQLFYSLGCPLAVVR